MQFPEMSQGLQCIYIPVQDIGILKKAVLVFCPALNSCTVLHTVPSMGCLLLYNNDMFSLACFFSKIPQSTSDEDFSIDAEIFVVSGQYKYTCSNQGFIVTILYCTQRYQALNKINNEDLLSTHYSNSNQENHDWGSKMKALFKTTINKHGQRSQNTFALAYRTLGRGRSTCI